MSLVFHLQHKKKKLQAAALLVSMVVMVTAGLLITPSQKAAALTASSFNPGHIIDDSVFTDSTALSANDIQNFLDAEVPTCDTNGTTLTNHPNGSGGYYTRAQWGAVWDSENNTTVGAAPYICLKDYVENTSAGTNNLQNPRTIPGGISAAQIIYNVAQEYGINPEVILVTLQKEQGLITDDWPWANEYTEAMGYNCPDTGPCSGYGDFYLQVNAAAAQFRNYLTNPNNFNYTVGYNSILYAPGCGSSTVYIQNQATAALYDYTPYQPDATVLANTNPTGSSSGPGAAVSGDSCAAYGNRNFWWYFNTWFGSSLGSNPISQSMSIVSPITASPAAPIPGQPVTVSYTVENTSSTSQTFQATVDQCRINTTGVCGQTVPWGGTITIAAGTQYTFTDSFPAVQAGAYTFTPFFEQNGTWWLYNSATAENLTVNVPAYVADMQLTGPITVSPSSPIPGQDTTVSYTVQNDGTLPAIYQTSLIQCRINTTGICGQSVPWSGAVTIAPGATQAFTADFGDATAGAYTFTPYFMQNNSWYTYGTANTPKNVLTVNVPAYVADMQLTGPITVSPSSPIPGQDTTVSYTVQNDGTLPAIYQTSLIQCRINTTGICGQSVPWSGAVTIAPGATQAFTADFGDATAGAYTFTPYFMQNNSWYTYGTANTPKNVLTVNVPAYVADMQLTGPITVSPSSPIPGQDTTVSYTVQNDGTLPAIYQTSLIQCRINTTGICGQSVPWSGAVTIAPGATQAFTADFGDATAGAYTFTPYFMQNNSWYTYGTANTPKNVLTVNVP